jgi:hypothetical protein
MTRIDENEEKTGQKKAWRDNMRETTRTIISFAITLLIALAAALHAGSPVPRQGTIEISGRVTTSAQGEIIGLAGVQMIFTSEAGETVSRFTDFDGQFIHEVESGWSGTIEPQKVSYFFEPGKLALTNITGTLTGQNFTASRGAVVKISGSVFNQDGSGLTGVVLQPFDSPVGFPGSAGVTDAEGSYELSVGTGWTGQVRAFKDGCTFTPPLISYDNNVDNDLPGQDYTASQAPLAISGRVVSDTGTGIHGVILSFSLDTGSRETVTDFNGNYRQEVPHGWSGTVTLSRSRYILALSPRTYNETRWSQWGQDYTATADGFIISGIVVTPEGNGIAGVNLEFSNNGGTAKTDANGNYYHAVPPGWSGAVTLSKTGYSFPAGGNYNDVRYHRTRQAYTGRAISPVIWGRVSTLYDTAIQGVRIDVSNTGGTPYTYTDDQGMYRFAVPLGWSGTVTPSKSNHTFSPNVKEYSGVTVGHGGQNYKSGNIIPVISGIVTDSKSRTGLGGVTLTFSNGGGTTETNDSGFFLRPVYLGWTGTLTVEKDGFVFLPFLLEYLNVTSHLRGQNFFALPGRIGLGLQVTRHISGSLTIRRHYAAIDLTFSAEEIFETISISSISIFIYRKEGDGEYREIHEITAGDLQTFGTFTLLDKTIEKEKTYTYKAVVIYNEAYNIKESEEKVI